MSVISFGQKLAFRFYQIRSGGCSIRLIVFGARLLIEKTFWMASHCLRIVWMSHVNGNAIAGVVRGEGSMYSESKPRRKMRRIDKLADADIRKLTQAAGLVLRAHQGKQIGYLRLIKLLYIANRESLRETGRPIVDDTVFAMKLGPVLSRTLNIIKRDHEPHCEFSAHIKTNEKTFQVELIDETGDDELSEFETDTLKEICARYKDKTDRQIVNETHDFPEWQRAWQAATAAKKGAAVIQDIDILNALGFADAEEMAKDLEVSRAFRHASA